MKKILIFLLIILMNIFPIFAKEKESFEILISEIPKNSLIVTDEISEINSSKNNISQFFGDLGESTLEILNSEEFLNSVLYYGVGMAFATVLIITVPPAGILTIATLKTSLIKTSVISATVAVAFWARGIIKESLKAAKAEICMKISNNEIIFVNKLLLKEGNLVIYDGIHPITFRYKDKVITTDDKGYIESIKSVVNLEPLSFIEDEVI
jgi:hypothetical protein